jgi:hypothetical protein
MSESSAAAFSAPRAGPLLHEPRSTGEIISDAVGVLRRSFGVVFSVAVPFCAADLLLREVAQTLLFRANGVLSGGNTDVATLLEQVLPNFLAGFGFFAASFFVQQLLLGAVTAVGEDAFMGRTPTSRGALARVASRGGPLILTGVVFMVAAVALCGVVMAVPTALAAVAAAQLGMPALVVPGVIVGIILSFGVLLVLTLRWSLYGPVVITEDRWLWGALKRSSALTAPRGLPFFETPRFRLSVLFLIALGISSVLQSLFVAPRLIIAVVTGWSFTDGGMPGLAQLPLWFAVPFGLIEVITNAAVIPLSGLLMALFMFDLRVRYDDGDADGSADVGGDASVVE